MHYIKHNLYYMHNNIWLSLLYSRKMYICIDIVIITVSQSYKYKILYIILNKCKFKKVVSITYLQSIYYTEWM